MIGFIRNMMVLNRNVILNREKKKENDWKRIVLLMQKTECRKERERV